MPPRDALRHGIVLSSVCRRRSHPVLAAPMRTALRDGPTDSSSATNIS